MLSYLPKLRRAFSACGCLLHTSALVREPVPHIVSAYRYFHLRDDARSPTTPLRPLQEWCAAQALGRGGTGLLRLLGATAVPRRAARPAYYGRNRTR